MKIFLQFRCRRQTSIRSDHHKRQSIMDCLVNRCYTPILIFLKPRFLRKSLRPEQLPVCRKLALWHFEHSL